MSKWHGRIVSLLGDEQEYVRLPRDGEKVIYTHYDLTGKEYLPMHDMRLYVGQTQHFWDRQRHHLRKAPWRDQINHISYLILWPEMDILEWEKFSIQADRPRHNTVHNTKNGLRERVNA